MSKPTILEKEADFSLVLGGPLFQLFRRAHLSGNGLELLYRRMLVIAGAVWLPLLLLSAFEGRTVGGAAAIPFLYDIEAHVRFLVALPILIAAELLIHQRIRGTVQQFVERGIVIDEDMPRFHQAIASTLRLRNSVIGEIVLVLIIYTFGLLVWRDQISIETTSWYATVNGDQMRTTAAGYWYFFVSLPIFQFILLRWYLRIFYWFWFLWRVARLDLRLVPSHPDRAGGLGFLGGSTRAFVPILVAQGAILAGLVASQIFHAGQELTSFKVQIAAFVAFFVVAILIPLTVFTPALARAKRQGSREFGKLANRYGMAFEDKWTRRGAEPADAELLGSADIQSLADLGNSYAAVREMRYLPFGMKEVTWLAAASAAPLLPLTLTMFSLEELVTQIVKVLF